MNGSSTVLETPASLSLGSDAHTAQFRDYVIRSIVLWRALGLKTALLTLVNVEGASPRPVGSQLAVNERGDVHGLISGGCLEASLIEEAKRCMQLSLTRWVRYGKDSDYFDIQLPCGSGVDVLILPIHDGETWPEQIDALIQSRRLAHWRVCLDSMVHSVSSVAETARQPQRQNERLTRAQMERCFHAFAKTFEPTLRVVVCGKGAVFDSFILLTQFLDLEILVYDHHGSSTQSPTDGSLFHFKQEFGSYRKIKRLSTELLDDWSVMVMLSHDHLYEVPILQQALQTNIGFICALGSKKTHENRIQALLERGVDKQRLGVLKGPAGLDIGSSNPPEIALSILSEIIAFKNGRL